MYQFIREEASRQPRPFEVYPDLKRLDWPDPHVILRAWKQRGQMPGNSCRIYGGGLESEGLPRGWRVLSLEPNLVGMQAGEDILVGGNDPYAVAAAEITSRLINIGGGCINVLCLVS